MSFIVIVLLVLTGIAVGFINTLSAGGTVISIALYLAMGIPPQTANAINRVGVLLQNGTASYIFFRKHVLNYAHILMYSLPVLIGAFLGANTAVNIDENVFNICFAAVMLLMIVFLFIDGKRSGKEEKPFTLRRYLICFVPFFITGFYGGFIQSGTGFLLIAVFGTMLGYDMLKNTAAKTTVMFLYTVVALSFFISQGAIEAKYWIYALLHSVGNVLGSFVAARYAVKKGDKFIKIMIMCIILLISSDLLGLFDLKIIFKNIIN